MLSKLINADSAFVPDLLSILREMLFKLYEMVESLKDLKETIGQCTSVEGLARLLVSECENVEYGDDRRVLWSEEIVMFVQSIFKQFPLLDTVEIVSTIFQSYKEHVDENNGAHQFVLSVEE